MPSAPWPLPLNWFSLPSRSSAPSGAQSAAATPTVKYLLLAGETSQRVQFNFIKHGHQGLHIESRRSPGNFEFMAVDTETPYLDERPLLVAGQPETREYRIRFWDKGTPNGEWLHLKVTVGV